jgi:hypothetical protein
MELTVTLYFEKGKKQGKRSGNGALINWLEQIGKWG